MAQSLDSLAEELTCSICLGLFNTPVTIPCGHNFCGECLELAWEACKLGEYRCPQCMCPFPSKPDLRKNTLLNNLVIQLQSLQLKPQEPEPVLLNVVKEDPCYSDGVLCDSCMALPAARTCLTCMASFCQEHLRPHLESPAFIHHLLKQPLRDLHARKCQEHEKLLDQYCREHLCCICCYCLANHKQCHTCTLQQGKMERKRDISNILQSLNQKIEKASNTAGELRREQKQVMDTVNKKKDLLEGEFEEIKALIEQEKMKSMRKIEEEEKKVNSKFGYTLSVLGKKKQEFEKMKSSVESLLLEEDDLQFLKRASKLHDTTSKEPYKPKMELDEKLLHQIFRNTVSLKDSIKAKLQQPDDTVEKMSTGGRHPKQDDTQEWKPSAASTERIPAGGRHPKQETPNKNTFASTPTFPEVERHPKKGKPRATGPHVPSATAPDDKNKPLAKSKRGPSVPDSREDVLKYVAQVTADPSTAHKRVLLSERNTKVSVSEGAQSYPDNPERFTHCSQVLCSQGFSQGTHYWEVDIQGGNFSGFGIAYRSIPRKGAESRLGRNPVSWCLEYFNGKLQAWHDEKETSLTSPNTNRIGLLLNYDEGFLSFFSVSKKFSQIYRFRAHFTEAVYPAFWVFSANAVVSFNTFS
ncbi:tripartite motif containing 25 isoform X2 [Xenopus tropicalis]|uniref:Tripartite motif containing 25 isoform X2 n=1 Tax=Xenopus tropicalis TaxID=8364 RepID=A0A8J1IW46_XENTR|nr:tripartite motif containing 25 isoform X2 [Xenopus tropicalis]